MGEPADGGEIAAIETALSVSIPDGVKSLLKQSRSVEFSWHFADSVRPPPPFEDTFAGLCRWDLENLVQIQADYRELVEGAFSSDAAYDKEWQDKFPFMRVPNGDMIALDTSERVIYLSGVDGDGHGYLLGSDTHDFVDRWSALGCPGPEDWQWLPFAADERSMLDPSGEAGTAWRTWFGI